MLQPSFRIIGLPDLEKNIFKGFYHIYGRGGHLGHATWTIYINFCSSFPRRVHMNFSFDWPSGFREENVNGRTTTTTLN